MKRRTLRQIQSALDTLSWLYGRADDDDRQLAEAIDVVRAELWVELDRRAQR
jgi:hypothetical protein